MNNISLFIANIYHYSLMVRDTLEYTMQKKEYSIDAYNQRKLALEAGIKDGTPLGNFFKQNEKLGEDIKAKIENFLSEIYADDSTVVQVSPEHVIRVDHAQHIKIYDFVVGIHETITDIIYGYMNFAKGRNELEPEIENLVKSDESFYRGFIYLQILNDLQKSFSEFNQAMNETKGQQSPQSNYIVKDIQKLVGMLAFIKEHCHLTDEATRDMFDDAFHLVEMTQGKRDLPEGKKFPDVFKSTIDNVRQYTMKAELVWKDLYKPVIDELVSIAKKEKEKLDVANENPSGKADA